MLATPELSQRLFGTTAATSTTTTTPAATTTTINVTSVDTKTEQLETASESCSPPMQHLPSILGLKIRAISTTQQQPTSTCNNTSSLLKQQLRTDQQQQKQQQQTTSNNNIADNALQSLANVANERQHQQQQQQAQTPHVGIQPPNASNLHHQFLMHMSTNPMLQCKPQEYYQLQQQQQQLLQHDELDIELDKTETEHELTLTDDAAGLDYKQSAAINDQQQQTSSMQKAETTTPTTTMTRPIQRRRIRRKAQSSIDDQAEHLTEMSVRGLDLFRYASISEGVYQCTECAKENMQKTFKNKYSFQRHAFLYHEGKHRKVFPCPVCSKEFSRPDKMKNHMKMTHESYNAAALQKDVSNLNSLNYLINTTTVGASGGINAGSDMAHAAAAMHFQQQQQQEALATLHQQQQQQHLDNKIAMITLERPPPSSPSPPLPQLHVKQEVAELNEPYVENIASTAQQQQQQQQSPAIPADAAILNIQNDIIIKNEIVISPTPSPPPPMPSCGSSNSAALSLSAAAAQTAT